MSYLFSLRVFFLLFLLLFLPDTATKWNPQDAGYKDLPSLEQSHVMVLSNGFFQAFKESEIMGVK